MFTVIPTLLLFKSSVCESVKIASSFSVVQRFTATFPKELISTNIVPHRNASGISANHVKILHDIEPLRNYFSPSPFRHYFISRHKMKMKPGVKKDQEIFSLDDYDAIGFDLDNTLALYNLKNLFEMEYNCLRDFLVEHKNYNKEAFDEKLDESKIEFMQRGLIVDAKRGNLLKVDHTGKIFKVAHGTTFLTENLMKQIYGNDLRWEVTNEFVKDFLSTWNGPRSEEMRSFLDYFDVPGVLIFAQAVDYLDKKNKLKPLSSYNVYKDILDAFTLMYTPAHFSENKGMFFPILKKNPEKYYQKCPPSVLKWLKELKAKNKILFVLTGSYVDFAHLTATTCLGEDWKDYFDYIGYFSKKPGFFTGAKRPFLHIENMKETDEIHFSELSSVGKTFSQGNWEGLMEAMRVSHNKTSIKPIYLGDNFIQDLYTPNKYAQFDTVAVCLEQAADSLGNTSHTNVNLKSKSWGPYFYNENGDGKNPTIWGNILKHHCKICVPTISYLAGKPVDHVYHAFDKNETGLDVKGIYPKV